MNKKLVAILAIAIVATVGTATFLSESWTSGRVTMSAATASTVSLGVFTDCACSVPFTGYNWDGVTAGQNYTVAAYVKNNGTRGVYITYTPGSLNFDSSQTRFRILVDVVAGGLTCQVNNINPIVSMPVKVATNCANGIFINPNQVIKIHINLVVDSVVSGGNWNWNFYIEGCAP